MGRSRYQTNAIRRAQPVNTGLGQFDDLWEYDIDWQESGMATSVPEPATVQGAQTGWSQYIGQITQAAQQILPAYYAAETAGDIAKINLERAARGQAPLPESYLRASAPQIRAGLAPDTQRMIFLLGGGLLLVLALPMLMRRGK